MEPYKIRNKILDFLYELNEEHSKHPVGYVPFHIEYPDVDVIATKINLSKKQVDTNLYWLELTGYVKKDLDNLNDPSSYVGYSLTKKGNARISSPFTKNFKEESDILAIEEKKSAIAKNKSTTAKNWVDLISVVGGFCLGILVPLITQAVSGIDLIQWVLSLFIDTKN